MKFRCGLCSLQIFNAIPLRFSRRLRNSPRPWVKHAQRRFSHIRISLYRRLLTKISNFTVFPEVPVFPVLSAFLHLQQPRLVNNPGKLT